MDKKKEVIKQKKEYKKPELKEVSGEKLGNVYCDATIILPPGGN